MSAEINSPRPGRLTPPGSARALTPLVSALLVLALCATAFASTASAACPNEAIRQQQGSTHLPDCMAFELVSSPLKNNQSASNPTFSPDGNRILYYSRAALGDTPGLVSPLADPYVGSRSSSGWTTTATAPPVQYGFKGLGNPVPFTAELDEWLAVAPTEPQALLGQLTVLQGGIGQPWVERASALTALNGPFASNTEMIESLLLQGASPDLSRLLFNPGVRIAGFLPGDPEPSDGGGSLENRANTYVLSRGSGADTLELLSRDTDGKVWGGTCGNWPGGGIMSGRRGGRNQGAISADGSRMYFSTRPAQPQPEAGDPASPVCDVSNPIRILEREETSAGVEIAELIPGGVGTGDDKYQGASTDGSKVYFTSPRKFLASDKDVGPEPCGDVIGKSKGCDLYLYDTDTEELIQVSAGDATAPTPGEGANVMDGVTEIATDGSRVYFVAQGVLTTNPNPEGDVAGEGELNLYVYQRDVDHPNGRTAFIARLDKSCAEESGSGPSDCNTLYGRNGFVPDAGKTSTRAEPSFGSNAIAVPLKGRDALGAEVGGDGHVLVFQAKAALTGDDEDGLQRDIFRYDARMETLECVSCGGNAADADDFDVAARSLGTVPMPNFAEYDRWADEDGDRVVFATGEALLPGDDDGLEKTYLWDEGTLIRLPSNREAGGNDQPLRPTVSADGSALAFQTGTPLLPQDGDTAADVYVARANGGFAASEPPPDCAGEACQGGPSPAPLVPARASESFIGPGNVEPGKRDRCARLAQRAKSLDRRAKQITRASRRAEGAVKKRRLNRTARRLDKRADRLSRSARRCARNNRTASADRGGLR